MGGDGKDAGLLMGVLGQLPWFISSHRPSFFFYGGL